MKTMRGSLRSLSVWFALAALSITGFVSDILAQTNYQWTTFAGSDGGVGYADGTGSAARFQHPRGGVAIDASGNLYIADTDNQLIRKITPTGEVTTLAGKVGAQGSSDGTGGEASFYRPRGIAVDRDGNVYVADTGNNTIRKITPAGEVSTLAGSPGLAGSVDGSGSNARFKAPYGLAVDSHGNVFVSDYSNHTIRKITPSGVVTTFAGNPSVSTGVDGTGMNAGFRNPYGLAIDASDNLYVADPVDATIRKITSSGVVTTLAGSHGTGGNAEGTGNAARFVCPATLALDSNGNLFVTDTGNAIIFKITPEGTSTTFAKNLEGVTDTPLFYDAEGIAVDNSGYLYVAAWDANLIYKIAPTGEGNSFAGKLIESGSADGLGNQARFLRPSCVAMDGQGNLYVADSDNCTIRKITSTGQVTTLAGSPGISGHADGTGSEARFSYCQGLVVDPLGNVFVADTSNNLIRKITPEGVVTTIAGSAESYGNADGLGRDARFGQPSGLALDTEGNLYVADKDNCAIRKITPTGVVSTIAGTSHVWGYRDGDKDTAWFKSPEGVAVDKQGNVFVADTGNNLIRIISKSGKVSTLAGKSSSWGLRDGTGDAALFHDPCNLYLDSQSQLYVADRINNTIRVVNLAGEVRTLTTPSGNTAYFNTPSSVVVDPSGRAIITEFSYHRITIGVPIDPPTVYLRPPLVTAAAPSHLTSLSATLPGTINALGLATMVTLEYGTTTAYGNKVDITLSPNDDIFSQTVEASINGLKPSVTYHYRLTATNAHGVTSTSDIAFTTPQKMIVTTFAGMPKVSGNTDGIGNAARFNLPQGVAMDRDGNIYVTDLVNRTVRKITPNGETSVLAGKTGVTGSVDGTGAEAQFMCLSGIAVDANGCVYVCDNDRIRKITPAGVVTTLAGSSSGGGSADGNATTARFNEPRGLTVDSDGNVYVADTGNSTIRKITPSGDVSTLAGSPGATGTTDGTGKAARFNKPNGVTFTSDGNLYVADTLNRTIRKITPAAVVSTLVFITGGSENCDGTSPRVWFTSPSAISSDFLGNLYVEDASAIHWFTASAVGPIIAGYVSMNGITDGPGNGALFFEPRGLTIDSHGNVYVADTLNHTIRKISPARTLSLSSALAGGGVLSGGGTFILSSTRNVTATPAEAYFFTNWTENGVVVSTSPCYSFTVSEDRNLVANFTLKPFYQWWTTHVMDGGVADPLVSGPAATPLKDGAPNLLKYLCRIDPSAPMSESDKSALPKMTVTERESKPYLTLTHRKNQAATDLNISVQSSTDLKSWQTITPDFTSTVGTDPQTGDEIIQYQVNTEDSTQKFIRLNVSAP